MYSNFFFPFILLSLLSRCLKLSAWPLPSIKYVSNENLNWRINHQTKIDAIRQRMHLPPTTIIERPKFITTTTTTTPPPPPTTTTTTMAPKQIEAGRKERIKFQLTKEKKSETFKSSKLTTLMEKVSTIADKLRLKRCVEMFGDVNVCYGSRMWFIWARLQAKRLLQPL